MTYIMHHLERIVGRLDLNFTKALPRQWPTNGGNNMYEVIIEDENLGTVTVMRSDNLGQCLDKQKRLIRAGHLDCYITRGKA